MRFRGKRAIGRVAGKGHLVVDCVQGWRFWATPYTKWGAGEVIQIG